MDLGIDRLIEMIEARFGRKAANVLLLLLVLGAAGWAVHSTFENIVKPLTPVAIGVANYVGGLHFNIPDYTWSVRAVLESAIAVFLTLILGLAAWRLDRRQQKRTADFLHNIATMINNKDQRIEDLEREIEALRENDHNTHTSR